MGKSDVATLLSHYFAQKGHRVMAIDLDHQGNFSNALQLSQRVALVSVTADVLLSGGIAAVPQQSFVLAASGRGLLGLERQPTLHTPFARNFRTFLSSMDQRFDVCVIDTNPNPDIRLIAALASTDHVLSPIQLKQEAMDGVAALLDHERVGLRKIKAVLNPKLRLLGLLPSMVEATPFEKINLIQVARKYQSLLIPLSERLGDIASIPRRSAIGEAQAQGAVRLWPRRSARLNPMRLIDRTTALAPWTMTGCGCRCACRVARQPPRWRLRVPPASRRAPMCQLFSPAYPHWSAAHSPNAWRHWWPRTQRWPRLPETSASWRAFFARTLRRERGVPRDAGRRRA